MKKFRIMCLAAASAALAMTSTGCEEAEPNRPVPPEINQNDIVFEAKEGELTSEGATITVTHNGTDKETYYGFWYTDLETNATNAINRVVAEFQETGTDLGSVVTTGKTHITVLNGLDPMTTYRYVVFGLNEDGTIYGTPGSVDFTTLKGEVKFTVSVSNVTETTANATVTSTGDNTDTWYCFATTDLTSPLAQVVSAEVERLGSSVSSVLKDGNNMVQLSGLTAGTSYRAVVTGLKSDGTTYGTPVSASFRTSSPSVTYTENPNWTVTYAGKGTTEEGPADMINVAVSAGTDTYMPGIVSVEYFNEIGIEEYVVEMVADYQAMIDMYAQMGLPITWADVLYTQSEQNIPFNVLDSSVEWYAVAFGVDTNGNPTGLYAMSEPFTPEELEASDEYNKWLGNWRIEDATGNGYDITIQAVTPEVNYAMSGWEAAVFGPNGGPNLEVGYDASTQNLVFVTNENMGTITVDGGEQCELGFYGTADDGYFYTGAYDIAIATMNQDNTTATVVGNTLEGETGPVTMVSMQFFGLTSNSGYSFSDEPTFPLTMTKTSAQSSGVAAKAMRFETKDYRLGTLRTTGTPHIVKSAK